MIEDWFEALARSPDDPELRRQAAAWAARQAPGPMGLETLKAAALGEPGAWFLRAADWRHRVHLSKREPPRQTPLRDGWSAWSYTDRRLSIPLAEVDHRGPEPLSSVLGPPERGSDDFLPYRAWCLQDPEGRWLLAHQHLDVEGREASGGWVRVSSDEEHDPRGLAELLALDRPEQWRADVGLGQGFVVERMDDHGNVFEVSRHATRAAALRRAAEMEARGHKQTYDVRRA
jgi:hypothetical protein